MTQIISSVDEWDKLNIRQQQVSLGFVPTMGALHEGHLSLMRRSRQENDCTVVSIFVNPTQFNDTKDYQNYPQTRETDIEKLKAQKVDYLFAPEYQTLYADDYRFRLSENQVSKILCGAHRAGHFDGVLTVVMKLLNIICPQHAYFGYKDYQQYLLIRDMVKAFFMRVEIIGCEIVREADGLAMSSRNQRLSEQQRQKAMHFPIILKAATDCAQAIRELESEGFKVDYVEEQWQRRLGAVHVGNVRLIDNIPLPQRGGK